MPSSSRLARTAPGVVAAALLAVAALHGARAADAPVVASKPVPAQPAASAPLVPVYAPDAELLQAFGGPEGLRRLSNDFVDRMRADPRIGHYFEKTKLGELKKNLSDQLCQVLAGPCVYEGDSMRASHADLGITRADSLAQVELLQASMDAQGIDFRAQNKLLARLAPMYREIITR